MSIIVEAHTGQKEGLSLEPSIPESLDELGPVEETTVPAVSAAEVASFPHGDVGLLVGKVYAGKRAAYGWRIFVGQEPLARLAVARHRSGRYGVFSFRLRPGEYHVAAWRPSGGFCGNRTARVARHSETRIALTCGP
jgi:hypothetical protein